MCVFNTYYTVEWYLYTFYLLDKFRLFEKRLCINGGWQPIARENIILRWNWSGRCGMYLKGLILKLRKKTTEHYCTFFFIEKLKSHYHTEHREINTKRA
jgi:hypothetical protein